MTRIVDLSERIFHKTLPALSEQFLTSSPPTFQNSPLFYSSLVRWKWAHLGGGFHKPDVFLPPFPPKSHYSDYQHCHSEHLAPTPHFPNAAAPTSCGPEGCAGVQMQHPPEMERDGVGFSTAQQQQRATTEQDGRDSHGFHWEDAPKSKLKMLHGCL